MGSDLMHIIGTSGNKVIVLETKPAVYYYVSNGLLAIPGKGHILPQFMDKNTIIGDTRLNFDWGWSRRMADGINMQNYRGWYMFCGMDEGIEILSRIKRIYDRNTKRR